MSRNGEAETVTGHVALVGAGPGDPELLTLKGLRRIESADAVVFDRLVARDILDRIPSGATRIYAGKALSRHHLPQAEINNLLVSLGRSGRNVVRLKGGDPFIFGRGSEEAAVLAEHGIPFEIVPGISAASGCSAYSGVPLTHRGIAQGVRYVTGHGRDDGTLEHEWAALLDERTTLVIYMGLSNLGRIARNLLDAGHAADIPAAIVENGTTENQRVVKATLGTLADTVHDRAITAPSVVIIGRVVDLGDSLAWFRPDAAGGSPWTDVTSG